MAGAAAAGKLSSFCRIYVAVQREIPAADWGCGNFSYISFSCILMSSYAFAVLFLRTSTAMPAAEAISAIA